MSTIYILIKTQGQYEDYVEENVVYFKDKKTAMKVADAYNKHYSALVDLNSQLNREDTSLPYFDVQELQQGDA